MELQSMSGGMRGRWRTGSAVSHLAIALAMGVVVGVVAGAVLRRPAPEAALAAWAAAAATFVAGTWLAIWPLDAAQTRAVATREDTSRPVANAIVFSAGVISFMIVAFVLIGGSPGSGRAAHVALGVVAIVASWLLVQTLWWTHYARLYYSDPEGGVDFNQSDGSPPVYSDFAYLAFTVGMAFQVSDQTITEQRMRRAVLGHAGQSFVFVAVILAVTINIVAGL